MLIHELILQHVDTVSQRIALRDNARQVAYAALAEEVTCAANLFPRLAAGLTQATGTTLTSIGTVERTAGVRFVDARGHAVEVARGFEHFVTER